MTFGLEYLVDVVVETPEHVGSGYLTVIEDISGFFQIVPFESNVPGLSIPLNQTRGMVVDVKTNRFKNFKLLSVLCMYSSKS